jgi:hypothetical protein
LLADFTLRSGWNGVRVQQMDCLPALLGRTNIGFVKEQSQFLSQ